MVIGGIHIDLSHCKPAPRPSRHHHRHRKHHHPDQTPPPRPQTTAPRFVTVTQYKQNYKNIPSSFQKQKINRAKTARRRSLSKSKKTYFGKGTQYSDEITERYLTTRPSTAGSLNPLISQPQSARPARSARSSIDNGIKKQPTRPKSGYIFGSRTTIPSSNPTSRMTNSNSTAFTRSIRNTTTNPAAHLPGDQGQEQQQRERAKTAQQQLRSHHPPLAPRDNSNNPNNPSQQQSHLNKNEIDKKTQFPANTYPPYSDPVVPEDALSHALTPASTPLPPSHPNNPDNTFDKPSNLNDANKGIIDVEIRSNNPSKAPTPLPSSPAATDLTTQPLPVVNKDTDNPIPHSGSDNPSMSSRGPRVSVSGSIQESEGSEKSAELQDDDNNDDAEEHLLDNYYYGQTLSPHKQHRRSFQSTSTSSSHPSAVDNQSHEAIEIKYGQAYPSHIANLELDLKQERDNNPRALRVERSATEMAARLSARTQQKKRIFFPNSHIEYEKDDYGDVELKHSNYSTGLSNPAKYAAKLGMLAGNETEREEEEREVISDTLDVPPNRTGVVYPMILSKVK